MPKVSIITAFPSELCAPEISETFVYKHTETIEYVKKPTLRSLMLSSLLFKKNTNFTGK